MLNLIQEKDNSIQQLRETLTIMQEITGERREAEIKAKKEQTKLETDL